MGVLRSPHQLAGVKRQTDRLAVDFRLGVVGRRKRISAVCAAAFRTVEAGAAADGEVLQVLGKEAQVHVVVHFHSPGAVEVGVAIRNTGEPGRDIGRRYERVVVPLLIVQRIDVEEALVR